MNHVFRLVWNDALARWSVAPETARGRGKRGSVKVGAGPAASEASNCGASASRKGWRWKTPLIGFFAVQQLLLPTTLSAQAIRTDGQTQTAVSTVGAVTNVSTTTVRNSNAFNSFQSFNVAPATTTNLHLPAGTTNLINIVRDERSSIEGMLNAVKDGRIGGNVWFANPHGMVVGPNGVVNVGSLSISTPTQGFVNNFFRSVGNPDDSAVSQLLGGTAPRNSSGQVVIQGQVNAIDGISLSAGSIRVGGSLYSGARFTGTTPAFTDVVNANGLSAGTSLVVKEGRIQIVADNDVQLSGRVAALGGAGVKGGDVSILAGGNIELLSGAQVLAHGAGAASGGGTVLILAQGASTLGAGALVDASAGQSGDGGFIEFSARERVELAGGLLRAESTSGARGSVLIDPPTVLVTQNVYTGGANYAILADQTITVASNITVSTRNLGTGGAAADQDLANSLGVSGNLTMTAPTITLQTGARLLAHANNGFDAGNVTLTATRSGGELDVLSDTATQITLTGATVKGGSVALRATSTHQSSRTPLVTKAVQAEVLVDSSTILAQSGSLVIAAIANADVKTGPLPIPVTVQTITARAKVDVLGSSTLTTLAGDASVGTTSSVTTDAKPTSFLANLAGDGSVAVSVVNSLASSRIGGTTVVNSSGAVALTASNTVKTSSIADASAAGSSAAGVSVAVGVVNSSTSATLDGQSQLTAGTGLQITAVSANDLVTTAKSAAQGAQEDSSGTSKGSQYLDQYKGSAQTSGGGVKVAGALAIADLNSATSASVATSGSVRASGAIEVSGVDLNNSEVKADGSATGGTVGVGVGVALNLAKASNLATIRDGTDVLATGVTVSAQTKAGATSTFSSDAKSGAGADNVGVAGALALGVLGTTTAASLQGDIDSSGLGAKVAANGGAVLISAGNRTSTTVKAGADVKPASDKASSKVGVGASVGVNVSLNTTRAEVEDKARLTGAAAVQLLAAAEHTVDTKVEGGAAGASVAVTPVVAVSIALNATTARLGTSATALDAAGAYTSRATHRNTVSTEAKGQTAGSKVSVGASLALTVATDEVKAEVERNVDATGAFTLESQSQSRSSTTASASVAGGKEADANDQPAAGSKTADQQMSDQKASARKTGGANDADSKAKLDADSSSSPTAQTSQGGVSVAAAIAVNVGSNRSSASVGRGRMVTSGGQVRVASAGETDAAAVADGSQTDSGGTTVGVGAAVALNVANATNRATIGDNAVVKGKGVMVNATMVSGQTSDFGADATSGAGAGKVGVAGSLAINVATTTSAALIEGDRDASGSGAQVDADGFAFSMQSGNKTASTVKAKSEVAADGAAAGVGASVGVNAVSNTSTALVEDAALVRQAARIEVLADAAHKAGTEVEGGAAGAKVSITPVVAVTVAVNTTTARVGRLGSLTAVTGALRVQATATNEVTNSAKGKAAGAVAVGASLSAAVVIDHVSASLERDVADSTGIDLLASSATSIKTTAEAGAKGAEEKKKQNGDPETGTTVDEQKSTQLDFAANRNDSTRTADTSSTETRTPDANTDEKGGTKQGGKKVSVAAAIAVSVAENRAVASVGAGRSVRSSGALSIQATTDTNYSTSASGEAVSDDVGIAAAVAASVTRNKTQATLGAGATVAQAGSSRIAATARQNRGADFLSAMSAKA
ncbi:MAG: leukotoxin LktA family filamentous adhesin, partial [Rhodoferax sp.]|nr:leukotoxin LktA family filamentous adhesin [Rhodoferax sp.]